MERDMSNEKFVEIFTETLKVADRILALSEGKERNEEITLTITVEQAAGVYSAIYTTADMSGLFPVKQRTVSVEM